MFWINVDLPRKVCTLHRADCAYRPKTKPAYKGFGSLERDGGWLLFEIAPAAETHYRQKWQPAGFAWVVCSACKPVGM